MRCINEWGGALEKAAARVRAPDVHQMFPHASYTLAQPIKTLVFYKCGWSVRHKPVSSVALAQTKKINKKDEAHPDGKHSNIPICVLVFSLHGVCAGHPLSRLCLRCFEPSVLAMHCVA